MRCLRTFSGERYAGKAGLGTQNADAANAADGTPGSVVSGLGFRVLGFGLRVQGFGFRI